jgi:hypothetical protein
MVQLTACLCQHQPVLKCLAIVALGHEADTGLVQSDVRFSQRSGRRAAITRLRLIDPQQTSANVYRGTTHELSAIEDLLRGQRGAK